MKKKTFGITVVILLNVAALFILFASLTYRVSPVITIAEQWDAISSGRLTEAYFAYTSKGFQAASSLSDFKSLIDLFPHPLDENTFKVIEVHDKLQSLLVLIQGADESFVNLYYETIKQGDEWKISSMMLVEGD